MAILTHFHRYISAIDSFQGAGHWPIKGPDHIFPQKELYNRQWGLLDMEQLVGMWLNY